MPDGCCAPFPKSRCRCGSFGDLRIALLPIQLRTSARLARWEGLPEGCSNSQQGSPERSQRSSSHYSGAGALQAATTRSFAFALRRRLAAVQRFTTGDGGPQGTPLDEFPTIGWARRSRDTYASRDRFSTMGTGAWIGARDRFTDLRSGLRASLDRMTSEKAILRVVPRLIAGRLTLARVISDMSMSPRLYDKREKGSSKRAARRHRQVGRTALSTPSGGYGVR